MNKNGLAKYITITLLLGSLYACKPEEPESITLYDNTPYVLNTGDFPIPEIPIDNSLTEQGVLLGRMLFYEKKLSKDGSMSCASCHKQEHAFSDNATFSTGVDGFTGKRHSMAIFNMAWNTNGFFWDGRAHSLREQSLIPIQDSLEMAETLENIVAKLKSDQIYKDQFARAFGGEEINSYKISLALEQFMNSIVSVDSKYDKWLRGEVSFTPSEKRGRKLFLLEYNPYFPESSGADCFHCHSTSNFANNLYRNNGLESEASMTDFGREMVTSDIQDRGKMKIPSLRNIQLTAPYMHDGRFSTLEEVVEHYDNDVQLSPTLSPDLTYSRITGLRLTDQAKLDLVAFLKTLTDYELTTNPEYSDPFK